MVSHNGQSPEPQQPSPQPQPAQPIVDILYRQHPNGMRTFEGLLINGQPVGGLIAIDTGMNVTQPLAPNVPNTLAMLTLKVAWQWRWKNVDEKDLLVATRIP